MPKKLCIKIGSDRFHEHIAWVNDVSKPNVIDSELFVGRVVVLVKDFAGVTPDGSPPQSYSHYFEGRTRRFAIFIEGRFKQRAHVPLYTADEVFFGSDFEFLPPSFPRTPFNVGMRIAKWIDPATFYEEHPPDGRPYIMSPYAACMNTFSAYPSPEAFHRAIVVAKTDDEVSASTSHLYDVIPREHLDDSWHPRQFWSFLGLRGDPRLEKYVSSHSALLLEHEPARESSAPATPVNEEGPTDKDDSSTHRPSSLDSIEHGVSTVSLASSSDTVTSSESTQVTVSPNSTVQSSNSSTTVAAPGAPGKTKKSALNQVLRSPRLGFNELQAASRRFPNVDLFNADALVQANRLMAHSLKPARVSLGAIVNTVQARSRSASPDRRGQSQGTEHEGAASGRDTRAVSFKDSLGRRSRSTIRRSFKHRRAHTPEPPPVSHLDGPSRDDALCEASTTSTADSSALDRMDSKATLETYVDALSRMESRYERAQASGKNSTSSPDAGGGLNISTPAGPLASTPALVTDADSASQRSPVGENETNETSITKDAPLTESPTEANPPDLPINSTTAAAEVTPEPTPEPSSQKQDTVKGKKNIRQPGRFSSLRNALTGSTVPALQLNYGDLRYMDDLPGVSLTYDPTNAIERQLGPWMFNDDLYAPIEDSNFVFLDPVHPRSVAQRRRHFVNKNTREAFVYDPDVVYATSFFAPFFDFNTFDMNMGPVALNLSPWFEDMPVRYTLRSSRIVPGTNEPETFVTISFQLVDW